MDFSPSAHVGTLHRYTPRHVVFEHHAPNTDGNPNTLIWIGGLSDGLLTVSYPSTLSQQLPSNWCLAEVLLSSSYHGWGFSSLKRDARELAMCVEYFQNLRPGTKVVLMGSSTGCQDVMEYLTGEKSAERPPIQGAILQACVSDREALVQDLGDEKYHHSVKVAQEMVAKGEGDEALPLSLTREVFFSARITANRWLSLTSPNKDGDDDYFSSDLTLGQIRKTFGALKKDTPLMILYSGADPYVPRHVDKQALVATWANVVKEGGGFVDEENGGIIEGASHNFEGDREEIIKDLVRRVNGFLRRLDRGDFKSGSHL